MTLTSSQKKKFIEIVYGHYAKHKRSHLPWRKTRDPYYILVSELMLQQTQVDRVIPKYTAFIATFPSLSSLARASLKSVLRLWQGLGYNNRAQRLHALAQQVTAHYKGKLPKTSTELQELPGIGPYTANAIMAFAYNKPVLLIETNIRAVYIHHFFHDQENITDAQLLPLIEETMDTTHPRKWYSALMDYGSYLKKNHPNPSRKSKHHTKQSRFEGSFRQKRARVLHTITNAPHALSFQQLLLETELDPDTLDNVLQSLKKDNMVRITSEKKYIV